VKMALEFDNIETVKRAVEVENGISLVPETTVRHEVSSGSLRAIDLEGEELWRPLGALVRRSARVSPALREFLLRLENTDISNPANSED
jgi:DNA-binding transcriptional LysR family regulator